MDPVLSKSPVGETKIPEPIIVPTISAIPLNKSTLFFKVTCLSSFLAIFFISSDVWEVPPLLVVEGLGMVKNPKRFLKICKISQKRGQGQKTLKQQIQKIEKNNNHFLF